MFITFGKLLQAVQTKTCRDLARPHEPLTILVFVYKLFQISLLSPRNRYFSLISRHVAQMCSLWCVQEEKGAVLHEIPVR